MTHINVISYGGGMGSLFHQALGSIIRNVTDLDSIGSFSIEVGSNHFIKDKHMFNQFFEEPTPKPTRELATNCDGVTYFRKVTEPTVFSRLKQVIHKNKIQ
jgi:hypothetical protein